MKKLGRPKLPASAEKKVVISGYVSASTFRRITKAAIRNKISISKEISNLLEENLKPIDERR